MAKTKSINKNLKKIVIDYIRHIQNKGIKIQKAYLFGSYARHKNNPWSDVDLCLISPQFVSENETWELLWQQRRTEDVDLMISPVGFHPDDFIDEDPLAFEIKQTGIELEF